MTASVEILMILVVTAIAVTAVAPLILITLWIKDWKKGQLW